MNLHPVILSGGAGTRLWPVSRVSCPKQFLPLSQIVEVQTGAYLDEDDIVRLEHAYHRNCEGAPA